MPLKVTYWTGNAPENDNVYGTAISSESLTISGTSAQTGATPDGAVITSIYATEAATFEYSSSNPTATATSVYIAAGERLTVDAKPGHKIAAITA